MGGQEEQEAATKGEEGEEMVARCKKLFQEDCLFQAVRLERDIADKFPNEHSKHKAFMQQVRDASEEAEGFCKDLQGDDGWNHVYGSKEDDIRVWYKPEADSPIHALRVAATIDAPLEYLLVMVNEITLFPSWLPFISDSELLSKPSKCERVCWWKIKSPLPAIFSHRDSCVYGRAIDGLDEDGCVLLLIRSLEEMEGVTFPEVKPKTVRIDIKYAAVKLIPINNNKTKVVAAGSVDPKIHKLPSWLINWVATKVCYMGVILWGRNARRVAEGKKDCLHRQRMREDAEFYAWMSARVHSFNERNGH